MTQRKKRKIFGRNEIIFLVVVGSLIIFFGGNKALDKIDCDSILGNEPLWNQPFPSLRYKLYDGIRIYSTDPSTMTQEAYDAIKKLGMTPAQAIDIADQSDAGINRLKSVEIRNPKLRQSWNSLLYSYTLYIQRIREWADNPRPDNAGFWLREALKSADIEGIERICHYQIYDRSSQ